MSKLDIQIINGREAILLQKVKDGLPFIPEEDVVYQVDLWKVIYLNTMKLDIAEITHEFENSYTPSGYSKYIPKTNILIDKFLEVNGKEIY